MSTRFLCLSLLLLPAGLAAQQNWIPNGSFDTADLSWWDLPVLADTTTVHSGFGNPGGALLIESFHDPAVEVNIEALGPCLTVEGSYWLSGEAYGELPGPSTANNCSVGFAGYSGPDCTGSRSYYITPTIAAGTWSPFSSGGNVSPDVVPSRRVSLRMERVAGPEPTRCYFDNLELLGPTPSPLEIPALGRWAFTAFLLCLATAALAVLRRPAA